MTERPDDVSGSGGEAKPWPVMDRSMLNYGTQPGAGVHIGRDTSEEFYHRRAGARWPGVVLALIGLMLAGVAFAGWTAILVRFLRGPEPSFTELLGPVLPSGLPAGVVHAFTFVVGALLMLAGTAMRRTRIWLQILVLILLFAAVAVLVIVALGGAPFSALLPHFSL